MPKGFAHSYLVGRLQEEGCGWLRGDSGFRENCQFLIALVPFQVMGTAYQFLESIAFLETFVGEKYY